MQNAHPHLFWLLAVVAGVTALVGDHTLSTQMTLTGSAFGLALAGYALTQATTRLSRDQYEAAACIREQTAEIERLETRLRDALARNSAKSLFLAEMSHELRTPLNSVIGFSEMMANEVLGAHSVPAYGDYARDILACGRHLLALADDILDLARIETGHRILTQTAVDLDALMQDCIKMMRPTALDRDVNLTYQSADRLARVWADERALRQIVINLLANALKFTPAGGAVSLTLDRGESGEALAIIEDTGPGIAEVAVPLASAAHARESTVDPQSGQGAGLGLAIVRALAELQGGDLTLSRREQGGTRAQLRFPPNSSNSAG